MCDGLCYELNEIGIVIIIIMNDLYLTISSAVHACLYLTVDECYECPTCLNCYGGGIIAE